MPFPIQRRRALLGATAFSLLGLAASHAAAQAYPSKPLRLIVPFPPGGPTDIVARPLAQLLGEALKQQVVVDNRGGAGGSIAADLVAKSPPDGYTLLMGTVGTSAINASLYKNLTYDPIEGFTPLAAVASGPIAVVVGPGLAVRSLAELVAQAKARPGAISYGSAGNGTPGHLAGALFASAAGIELTHVPYKGSAAAVTDLLGGQIPLMFDPLQSVLPHIVNGKLRALAVTSRSRAALLPDVPTVAEAAGLPGFETIAWWAVFGPAKMPVDVAGRLTAEIGRIVRSPEYKRRLGNLGVQPFTDRTTPLAAFQKSEAAKWGKAVRDANITLE